MVKEHGAQEATILRLRARVTELEAILERRSLLLRRIQSSVCPSDLAMISEILDTSVPTGESAAEYYAMNWLDETFEPTRVDVESAMKHFWAHSPGRTRDGGAGE